MPRAKVVSNIDQLAEGIGSYLGMMRGLDQGTYMDALLNQTFAEVAPQFNKHAAAKAMGDKSLSHMWEFGTAGITRGRAKYANPTSPAAMLWQNAMVGGGGRKTITFVFKPAKSFVPPHTEEDTGVAQTVLDKLKVNTGERKYKFENKAFVFESGVDVTIMAKRAKQLFIPTKTEGLPSGQYSRRWGYSWAKGPHTYSPGEFAGSTGRFTGFFGGWWAGPGSVLMQEAMFRQVEMDLRSTEKGIKPGRRMTSVTASNIKAAVARGEKKTRKQMTLKVAHELEGKTEVIV